ncbi:MAG: polyhydroxyalkanoic acid system family protein [Acidobacteriota bacterium]
MAEIKPLLDDVLKKEFPGGMLGRTWNGDVLELSGPGATGSIQLEEGHLVGRATLKPPASMMRAVIEEKITAAIKAAAS